MQAGIHDLTNEQYHSAPGLSASGITEFRKSPRKFWYRYLSGKYQHEQTKAMRIGSVVHCLVLEPQETFNRYIIHPDGIDRRTKQGKIDYEDFTKLAANKTILKKDEFDHAQAMANALKSHKSFGKIMQAGFIEQSIFWQQDGTLCKSRPDYYDGRIVVDIKTTSAESQEEFERSIVTYGYHRQAAMQLDAVAYATGSNHRKHLLYVVEDAQPHEVAIYMLDETAINQGRIEYLQAAKDYQKCIDTNIWPSYNEQVAIATLPLWYIRNNQGNL